MPGPTVTLQPTPCAQEVWVPYDGEGAGMPLMLLWWWRRGAAFCCRLQLCSGQIQMSPASKL